MSYSGATAASSVANPPRLLIGSIGGGANSTAFTYAAGKGNKSLWLYGTSDSATDLQANTYFKDGWQLGMRTGDLVLFTCSTGSSIGAGLGVISSNASTAGCGLGSGAISTTSLSS